MAPPILNLGTRQPIIAQIHDPTPSLHTNKPSDPIRASPEGYDERKISCTCQELNLASSSSEPRCYTAYSTPIYNYKLFIFTASKLPITDKTQSLYTRGLYQLSISLFAMLLPTGCSVCSATAKLPPAQTIYHQMAARLTNKELQRTGVCEQYFCL